MDPRGQVVGATAAAGLVGGFLPWLLQVGTPLDLTTVTTVLLGLGVTLAAWVLILRWNPVPGWVAVLAFAAGLLGLVVGFLLGGWIWFRPGVLIAPS